MRAQLRFRAPCHNPYGWLLKVRPALAASVLKRALRVERALVETTEGLFAVDPASILGDTLLRQGVHEPGTIAHLKEHLKPGATFVDLGANEGYFSVIASRLVGANGRVVAVEPQNRLQAVLRINLNLNHCRNVSVVQAAVGAGEGELTLYLNPSTNTGASSAFRSTKYPLPTQQARVRTLTALLDEFGIAHADLVKIDIEGYEGEAIAGARELLRNRRIGAISLAYHEAALLRNGSSRQKIESELLAHSLQPADRDSTTLYILKK